MSLVKFRYLRDSEIPFEFTVESPLLTNVADRKAIRRQCTAFLAGVKRGISLHELLSIIFEHAI